jgi:hypothetical protein
MWIVHRQQKAMIQAVTDLARDLLEEGKIEDQFILAKRPLQLYQHAVIMTVQALALATKGNEMC